MSNLNKLKEDTEAWDDLIPVDSDELDEAEQDDEDEWDDELDELDELVDEEGDEDFEYREEDDSEDELDDGKPILKLIGLDGNVFNLLGAAQHAARKAKWPKERLDAFLKEAFSGDYDNVLRLCMQHFTVR